MCTRLSLTSICSPGWVQTLHPPTPKCQDSRCVTLSSTLCATNLKCRGWKIVTSEHFPAFYICQFHLTVRKTPLSLYPFLYPNFPYTFLPFMTSVDLLVLKSITVILHHYSTILMLRFSLIQPKGDPITCFCVFWTFAFSFFFLAVLSINRKKIFIPLLNTNSYGGKWYSETQTWTLLLLMCHYFQTLSTNELIFFVCACLYI